MATYAELLQAEQDPALHNKIKVAIVVAAELVRTANPQPANQASRLVWAKNAFANLDNEVKRMKWAVLAQNRSLTLAQIVGASDAGVQDAVNNAVDVFTG